MTATNDSIRVTHVIAPAPAGGAETVVRGLVSAGVSHGLDSRVMALLQIEGPSPFVDRLRAEGFEVGEIRCGRRQYWQEAAVLGKSLDTSGAEVLHTHVYHGDMVGFLAARGRRTARVATVHGFTGGDWKNRLYQWIDQQLLRRFDGVIAVSETVQAQLHEAGVPAARVYLVTNAYQPAGGISRAVARQRLAVDDRSRIVGWVGRLSAEKGPDLFVSALADGRLADATGLVIGDGSERAPLEAQRSRLGLGDDRVRFAGARHDAAEVMSAFDVMVLSSRTEGTPMALLEAISAGIPVVAYAVGGIPQVLDAESGWLVKPEDPQALATAIRQVLDSPEEGRRRAARAREILATRFGVDRWMEQIRRVYRSAMEVAKQRS